MTADDGSPLTGYAAGVPYVAVPPRSARPDAPIVVVWHLLDPPRTERAMAAAIPLQGLDAWRVYLGLPLCSARLPEGGLEALVDLAGRDVVRSVHRVVAFDGAAEFPAAFAELGERLGFGNGPLGLVGGSMGSVVAQLVTLESAPSAGLHVEALVLLSPVARLRTLVDNVSRHYGARYPWDDETTAVARRLDFVARAPEFAALGAPAVRMVVGVEDAATGAVPATRLLYEALVANYADPTRVDRVAVPGMAHALADEPGLEPAPQGAQAQAADAATAEWLQRWLPGS